MAVVEELIRLESDGSISFGDYLALSKQKVPAFKVKDDTYYVKTFEEITRLEKNGKLLFEAVPGAAVHNFITTDKGTKLSIEGIDDVQVTMELEPETEYRVIVDDFNVGSVKSSLAGKIAFSVDTSGKIKEIKLEKM
jgi:hypothetical protein